jgi:hypothetical protein
VATAGQSLWESIISCSCRRRNACNNSALHKADVLGDSSPSCLKAAYPLAACRPTFFLASCSWPGPEFTVAMSIRALLLSFSLMGLWSLPAAADSWLPSSSSWNPLPKNKGRPVGVSRSSKKPSMAKSAGKTLANITQTPGELLAKSKSILPGGAPKPTTHSHSRQVSRVQKKDEKSSLLKSMFVNEPSPPPRTVGEWMALKRIDP